MNKENVNELNTKRLETQRLILRKFELSDADGMFNNWATDEKSCRYLSWSVHKNVEETKSVIKSWIEEYKNGSYNWIVELKETREVIGSICVISISKMNSTAEVAYSFGSKYWGCGYATETLRRVLEYLLNDCGFYLIEADYISGNPISGRVMEKAGMHKDAILRERGYNKYTNERNDTIVYSIKKDEL